MVNSDSRKECVATCAISSYTTIDPQESTHVTYTDRFFTATTGECVNSCGSNKIQETTLNCVASCTGSTSVSLNQQIGNIDGYPGGTNTTTADTCIDECDFS
jgi:hypothetical protein